MTPKEATMTDALATALRTLHAGPRPFPGIVGGHSAESAAVEIAAYLTASGYSLVPTEELAGLRAAVTKILSVVEEVSGSLPSLDRLAVERLARAVIVSPTAIAEPLQAAVTATLTWLAPLVADAHSDDDDPFGFVAAEAALRAALEAKGTRP